MGAIPCRFDSDPSHHFALSNIVCYTSFVPLISEFFGIKIYMYWAEHFPMHFHAEYGNSKAIISIEEASVIKGMLPAKQLKLVLAWCEIRKTELIENWQSAQQHKEIRKINPLK